MENFTVNITGDVNIILPHGKIPRRVRLKSDGYAPVSGFQLTPNDEEYDESNVSVLLTVPGQKAKSMRLLDALIETDFRCTHVRQVPTFDLTWLMKESSRDRQRRNVPDRPCHCVLLPHDELWDISSGCRSGAAAFEEHCAAPSRRRNDPAIARKCAPVHMIITKEAFIIAEEAGNRTVTCNQRNEAHRTGAQGCGCEVLAAISKNCREKTLAP